MQHAVYLAKAEYQQHKNKAENIKVQTEYAMINIIIIFSAYVKQFKNECKERQQDKKHLRQAV